MEIKEKIIEAKYLEAVKGFNQKWRSKVDINFYNYILNLPEDLRITYLIVVLESQVVNGGFHQYFINHYGQFVKETIISLIKIGAVEKAKLLQHAFDMVNADNLNYSTFRKKLINQEIEILNSSDQLFDDLNKLDLNFYTLDKEDIIELLAVYLSNL